MHPEVVIVGGGPAGAYCGFELANNGIYPLILDHSYPREKPCGGGISPPIIRKFPFVEKLRSYGFTFGDFKIITCTDNEVITESLRNGFCISRRILDEAILSMAIERGAKFSKERVTEVKRGKDSWEIQTDKRTIFSSILVGADGVNSIVRRRTVGPISTNNLAMAFGYIATPVENGSATIKFLAEFPGYIWVFPGKNYSNIGIGSQLKYGKRLRTVLDKFIKHYYPDIRNISKFAALLPSAEDPKFFDLPCAGDNWVLIGDAAGHVDPISGGGILYALWGGRLAALSIKENDPKIFDTNWRQEYGTTLIEQCKNKDEYYNAVKSTLAIYLGLLKNIYRSPSSPT